MAAAYELNKYIEENRYASEESFLFLIQIKGTLRCKLT